MTEELKKEIMDILDNVSYWETCPEDYKVRIKAISEQLIIADVVVNEADIDFEPNIQIKHKTLGTYRLVSASFVCGHPPKQTYLFNGIWHL